MRRFPVGRRLDVRRGAEALGAPGIDPRTWVAYGLVDDDPDAISVEAGGVFVDVTLQPSGKPITCRFAGVYAAPDGTVFFPIRRGDEVMVLVPDGDEDEGCTCLPRFHNDIDTFPLTVNGRQVDGTFPFVKIEQGDWEIEVAGDHRVMAGGQVLVQGDGTAPEAARKGDAVEVTPADLLANPAWQAWLAAVGTATGAGPPPPDAIRGTVTQGSSKVKIGG